MQIKPLSDAALRYEMGQTAQTFVLNMLKDYLRANYDEFQSNDHKITYCLGLIEHGFNAIFAEGERVFVVRHTPFGDERVLTKLGTYIWNIYRAYRNMGAEQVIYIVDTAVERVG
jgi:hypothetical protein